MDLEEETVIIRRLPDEDLSMREVRIRCGGGGAGGGRLDARPALPLCAATLAGPAPPLCGHTSRPLLMMQLPRCHRLGRRHCPHALRFWASYLKGRHQHRRQLVLPHLQGLPQLGCASSIRPGGSEARRGRLGSADTVGAGSGRRGTRQLQGGDSWLIGCGEAAPQQQAGSAHMTVCCCWCRWLPPWPHAG